MSATKTSINIKTESKEESLAKDDLRQCNICFDDIKSNMLVNTPCGHTFCNDCFFEWMKENYTCPCCRTLIIKREENQQRVLSVNRAEIAVQEQEIEELTEDVGNLRRLQKVHKRRITHMEKNNKKLMARQMRVRMMLQETREVRNKIVQKIRKIIPDNKLKNFIKKFYKNIINGKSEEAFNEAKNLIIKASLHEWKGKMLKVLDEFCQKYDVCRSSMYREKVLNDLLSNHTHSILCKRNNNEISMKELVEEVKEKEEEDKTSGDEEEKMAIEEGQEGPARDLRRRRVRLLTPVELTARIHPEAPDGETFDVIVGNPPFSSGVPERTHNTLPFQFGATQNVPTWPSFPRTSWPGQFQLNRSSGQQEIFTFGQITEEVEEEVENSGHHGVVISEAHFDPIALHNLFNETEEETIE